MNSSMKRFLGLALILALCLALCACGKTDESGKTDAAPTASATKETVKKTESTPAPKSEGELIVGTWEALGNENRNVMDQYPPVTFESDGTVGGTDEGITWKIQGDKLVISEVGHGDLAYSFSVTETELKLIGAGERGETLTYTRKGSSAQNQAAQPTAAIFANKNMGEIVAFGSYEQDNNTANGKEPIEWIVIGKRDDGGLVMMSKYALDAKPYNTEKADVTWETCSLRKWLNEDFYNAAFSAEEQAKIVQVTLENEDNPKHGTSGGNATKDRVWLLSINEVCDNFGTDKLYTYFTDGTSRKCDRTRYAKAQGVENHDGTCYWWLRSPGSRSNDAAIVFDYGSVYSNGNYVSMKRYGVRPVIVVRL